MNEQPHDSNATAPIRREVDISRLGWPTTEEIASDDGGFGNRQYHDLRGCTWSDVKDALELEERLLSRAEGPEAQDDIDEQQEWGILLGLDVGVASSVLALSAARCVPIASCNGMPGHQESCPIVALYCRPPRVADLLAVAEVVHCGLENGYDGALIAYADDVKTMMEFARELMARRNKLSRIRPPKAEPQPTGEAGSELTQMRLSLVIE